MTRSRKKFIFPGALFFFGLAEYLILVRKLSLWAAILTGIIVLVSYIIHITRFKKCGCGTEVYVSSLLGINSNTRGRVAQYDWIRLIACILVLLTHAGQICLRKTYYTTEYSGVLIIRSIYTFAMACTPIYVMLSGALLLGLERDKKENIFFFYIRHILRVVMPMAVYFYWYMIYNMELKGNGFGAVAYFFTALFTKSTSEAPHYWFLYIILLMYLITPLLKVVIKQLSYRMLTALIALLWGFSCIRCAGIIPNLYSFPMEGWIGVYLTGYWVTREQTRRADVFLKALGVCGIAIVIWIVFHYSRPTEYVSNTSPVSSMIAVSIFALVLSCANVFGKSAKVLRMFSRYSYGIVLVHWQALNFIVLPKLTGYELSRFTYAGTLALIVVLGLIVSFFEAVWIDNFLLLPFGTLLDRLWERRRIWQG